MVQSGGFLVGTTHTHPTAWVVLHTKKKVFGFEKNPDLYHFLPKNHRPFFINKPPAIIPAAQGKWGCTMPQTSTNVWRLVRFAGLLRCNLGCFL